MASCYSDSDSDESVGRIFIGKQTKEELELRRALGRRKSTLGRKDSMEFHRRKTMDFSIPGRRPPNGDDGFGSASETESEVEEGEDSDEDTEEGGSLGESTNSAWNREQGVEEEQQQWSSSHSMTASETISTQSLPSVHSNESPGQQCEEDGQKAEMAEKLEKQTSFNTSPSPSPLRPTAASPSIADPTHALSYSNPHQENCIGTDEESEEQLEVQIAATTEDQPIALEFLLEESQYPDVPLEEEEVEAPPPASAPPLEAPVSGTSNHYSSFSSVPATEEGPKSLVLSTSNLQDIQFTSASPGLSQPPLESILELPNHHESLSYVSPTEREYGMAQSNDALVDLSFFESVQQAVGGMDAGSEAIMVNDVLSRHEEEEEELEEGVQDPPVYDVLDLEHHSLPPTTPSERISRVKLTSLGDPSLPSQKPPTMPASEDEQCHINDFQHLAPDKLDVVVTASSDLKSPSEVIEATEVEVTDEVEAEGAVEERLVGELPATSAASLLPDEVAEEDEELSPMPLFSSIQPAGEIAYPQIHSPDQRSLSPPPSLPSTDGYCNLDLASSPARSQSSSASSTESTTPVVSSSSHANMGTRPAARVLKKSALTKPSSKEVVSNGADLTLVKESIGSLPKITQRVTPSPAASGSRMVITFPRPKSSAQPHVVSSNGSSSTKSQTTPPTSSIPSRIGFQSTQSTPTSSSQPLRKPTVVSSSASKREGGPPSIASRVTGKPFATTQKSAVPQVIPQNDQAQQPGTHAVKATPPSSNIPAPAALKKNFIPNSSSLPANSQISASTIKKLSTTVPMPFGLSSSRLTAPSSVKSASSSIPPPTRKPIHTLKRSNSIQPTKTPSSTTTSSSIPSRQLPLPRSTGFGSSLPPAKAAGAISSFTQRPQVVAPVMALGGLSTSSAGGRDEITRPGSKLGKPVRVVSPVKKQPPPQYFPITAALSPSRGFMSNGPIRGTGGTPSSVRTSVFAMAALPDANPTTLFSAPSPQRPLSLLSGRPHNSGLNLKPVLPFNGLSGGLSRSATDVLKAREFGRNDSSSSLLLGPPSTLSGHPSPKLVSSLTSLASSPDVEPENVPLPPSSSPLQDKPTPPMTLTDILNASGPSLRPRRKSTDTPAPAKVALRSGPNRGPTSSSANHSSGQSSQQEQSFAPVMSMTEAQLKSLTVMHTTQNQKYFSAIEKEVIRKEGNRPPSPTSKVRTVAQRNEMDRAERANKRRGDTSDEIQPEVTERQTHVRGPGDDEDYSTPLRPGKRLKNDDTSSVITPAAGSKRSSKGGRKSSAKKGKALGGGSASRSGKSVKWDKGLVMIPPNEGMNTPFNHRAEGQEGVEHFMPRSCIKTDKIAFLDRHGNLTYDLQPLNQLIKRGRITYSKIIYDDDEEPSSQQAVLVVPKPAKKK